MPVEGVMKCVKLLLFFFNFIFCLCGLALIVLGIFVQVSLHHTLKVSDPMASGPPIVITAIGVVVFFIAFFGSFGAWKESYCMITLFSIFLSLIFITEIGAAIAGSVFSGKVDTVVTESLTKLIDAYESSTTVNQTEVTTEAYKSSTTVSMSEVTTEAYKSSTTVSMSEVTTEAYKSSTPFFLGSKPDALKSSNMVRDSVDELQKRMKCCGVSNSSDWVTLDPDGKTVPDSCCITVTTGCGKGTMTDAAKVNTQGCRGVVAALIKNNNKWVIVAALVTAFLHMFGIGLSCVLMKGIRST